MKFLSAAFALTAVVGCSSPKVATDQSVPGPGSTKSAPIVQSGGHPHTEEFSSPQPSSPAASSLPSGLQIGGSASAPSASFTAGRGVARIFWTARTASKEARFVLRVLDKGGRVVGQFSGTGSDVSGEIKVYATGTLTVISEGARYWGAQVYDCEVGDAYLAMSPKVEIPPAVIEADVQRTNHVTPDWQIRRDEIDTEIDRYARERRQRAREWGRIGLGGGNIAGGGPR